MDVLLAAVTFGCGLTHHIVFVLQPGDENTKMQRVFPIINWAFVSAMMGLTVPWISGRLGNQSWAFSLPIVFFLVGTWIGHIGIMQLRGREKRQRKKMITRVAMRVEEESGGQGRKRVKPKTRDHPGE